jgi:hypothetical protein
MFEIVAAVDTNNIVAFGAIIGVYILVIGHMGMTYKKLGEIYKVINDHKNDAPIHRDENHFASAEAIDSLKENFNLQIRGIKEANDKTDKNVNEKFDGLSTQIQEIKQLVS